MKKILAGAVGSAAVFAAIFGAGPAQAVNEYAGLTYEQAAEYISNSGAKAVVSSRVGEYLPTSKCIVTGSRNSSSLDSSGNNQGAKVLLDLNCTDTMTAGHPGYSAATPQGQKAKQLRETSASINEDYAAATAEGAKSWCEENADSCSNFCQREGASCSAEVLQALGL